MSDIQINTEGWIGKIQSFFHSKPRLAYGVLFLFGALNVFSYSPFELWPLVFLCVTPLILAISLTEEPKQAAKYGLSWAVGWFATGISWVHVAIADFGGLPTIISVILMALLDFYLALFPALACYLAVRYRPYFGSFFIVPAWLFAEWLRSFFLTGFPWLSLGYTQSNSPLNGFAPVIGEFGLQAVVVFISLMIVRIALLSQDRHYSKTSRITPVLPIAILFTAGFTLQNVNWFNDAQSKSLQLALVQGNIQQSIKWQPENEMPTMLKYLEMSQPHLEQADIIIWPEAAVPRLEIVANDYLREIDRLAAMTNTAIVTGIVDYQPETDNAYNNIIVLGKKQAEDKHGHYKYLHSNRFSKHHLLPIGEFIPFEDMLRGIAPLFDLPMSSFSRGEYQQENLIANGFHLSPAICFEIAFADQVRANLYEHPSQRSDFILTLSNDAWFGDSHGPWQHLQIAQMRALEFATPVVRVTNNGITAIIDHQGNITAILPQFEADSLLTSMTVNNAVTFYQRFGDWPIVLTFGLACVFLFRFKKKRIRYVSNELTS